MLQRLTSNATPGIAQRSSVLLGFRPLHTLTRRTLAAKENSDLSRTVGAASSRSRVHPGSAHTWRRQRRTDGAAPSPSTSASPFPASTPTRKARQQSAAGSKPPSSPSSGAPEQSRSTGSARGKRQFGRFNRIAADKGLAFASFFYVVGESTTLGVAYLLHSNILHTGEVGSWLAALGASGFVDGYLERGPTLFGIRLSPRLLLNYLLANLCTYPLYRFQYSACLATARHFGNATAPLRLRLRKARRTKAAIPKAPSVEPQ